MLRHLIGRRANCIALIRTRSAVDRLPCVSSARSFSSLNSSTGPSQSGYIRKSHSRDRGSSESNQRENQDRKRNEDAQSRWTFFRFFGTGSLAAASIITYNHYHTKGPPNFNNNNSSRTFEDLHQAILEGDERRARVLLKNSTPQDVNFRHNLGWQLIHLAAVNGRPNLVELLLESGAEINSPDNYTNPRLLAEQHNIDPLV